MSRIFCPAEMKNKRHFSRPTFLSVKPDTNFHTNFSTNFSKFHSHIEMVAIRRDRLSKSIQTVRHGNLAMLRSETQFHFHLLNKSLAAVSIRWVKKIPEIFPNTRRFGREYLSSDSEIGNGQQKSLDPLAFLIGRLLLPWFGYVIFLRFMPSIGRASS
jgi:hypothetical protein